MPISFQCDQCSKPYVVSDGLAGKKAMCKQCGNRMTIPGDAVPSSTSAPVAAAPRPAAPRPATAVPVSRPKPVTTKEPAFDDIYGLNEAPSALPPAMPRIGAGGSAGSGDDTPVKKKKKKGFFSSSGSKKASAASTGGVSGWRLVGIVLAVIGGIFGAIRGFNLAPKSEVHAFHQQLVALNTELVTTLSGVRDVPTATAASARAQDVLRRMTEHFEKNGTKKGRQQDIQEANTQ